MIKMKSPIFIGGSGRSGTTLMRVMLDAHPDLACGPEFKMIPGIASVYKSMMSPSYRDIGRRYGLKKEDVRKNYQQFIENFFEPFMKENGVDRIIEKTPNNLLFAKELSDIFPNPKFIHLVRDGRDVMLSLLKMEWKDLNSGEKLWFVKDAKGAIIYWMQIVAECIKLAKDPFLFEHFKMVRYEDLIDEPEEKMKEVIHFVGEEWSDEVLGYYKKDRQDDPVESSAHQVSKKIYKDSKQKWKSEMTREQGELFLSLGGGTLLKYLGYEKDDTWIEQLNQ